MNKNKYRFFIKNQCWVSLMISLLCLFFGFLHHSIHYNRIGIVFLLTLSAYNFICYQSSWAENRFKKTSFYLVFICLLLVVCLLYQEKDIRQFIHILLVGSIVIMYKSDFVKVSLRNVPLLKIFLIAFAWAYTVLWIGNEWDANDFTAFILIYLFIIGITIPFDICDMHTDAIITLPKWLGIRTSKGISCICLSLSALLFILSFYNQIDMQYVWAWVITCLSAIGMVVLMGEKDLFFFTRFWMETCSGLPVLLVVLQKIRVVLL